jgi:hypothetical protein
LKAWLGRRWYSRWRKGEERKNRRLGKGGGRAENLLDGPKIRN